MKDQSPLPPRSSAPLLPHPPAPLSGKRIVVTRTAHQAGDLAAQLAAAGATPLLIPAIRIAPLADLRPLDDAIQRLYPASGQAPFYDWLLFTSVNAVAIFWSRYLAVTQAAALRQPVKVAAVGAVTAAALNERGIPISLTPPEFIAEALLAGLGDVAGQRILLPRAAAGRREVADWLRERGAWVDDIPLYETLPAELDAAAQAELARGVDAITFASSSAVRHLHRLAPALLQQTPLVCIGPITAATARQLGLEVAAVAEEYSGSGLVMALRLFFSE
jgi:uroporphyrinogen-III synthase